MPLCLYSVPLPIPVAVLVNTIKPQPKKVFAFPLIFSTRPFSEQRLTAVTRCSVRCVAVHYSRHLNYLVGRASPFGVSRRVGGTHHCTAFEWLSVFVTFMPHFVKIGQVIYTDTKRGHLFDLPFLSERWLGWCRILGGVWGMSGDRGSTVVKVLCNKSEGRWFDPS